MTYSGNRVFNLNNFVAVILALLGIVVYISNPDDNLPLIIIPVAFFITTLEAFYFEITPDELITRNYMIPFLNIRYKLAEITQVVLLRPGARATTKARVKIIRGDKRSIPVNAASLDIKEWQLFINDLSAKKIPIKIEAYSLKSTIGIPEQ